METVGNVPGGKSLVLSPDRAELLDPDMPVSWAMNREVISVQPDLLLTSLENLFVSQDLSRVPVIDDAGVLLGIVSKTDLVTHHLDEGDSVDHRIAGMPDREGVRRVGAGFHMDTENGDTVADLMCQTVVTVTEDTTIGRAAELMAVNRVHGLPVVAVGGEVIGWISALDVVSWVAGVVK